MILSSGVDQVPLPETVVPNTIVPPGIDPDDIFTDGEPTEDGDGG